MSKKAFSKSVLEKLETQEQTRLKNDLENSKKPRIRHPLESVKISFGRQAIRADFIDFLWITSILIIHQLTSINVYALLVLGLAARIFAIIHSLKRSKR